MPSLEVEQCFKVKDEGNIQYIDVVSLYPTVQYYDPFPLGHPEKIYRPRFYDFNWFGFVKCKVLAPKDLYLPVLPVKVKINGYEKLVFPLCVKCTEMQQPTCNHTDEERSFTGTWSTIEVREAFSQGYTIEKIYEVWHFEQSTELWKDYVANFLKIKLESSPHTFPTKEEYAVYIKKKKNLTLI